MANNFKVWRIKKHFYNFRLWKNFFHYPTNQINQTYPKIYFLGKKERRMGGGGGGSVSYLSLSLSVDHGNPWKSWVLLTMFTNQKNYPKPHQKSQPRLLRWKKIIHSYRMVKLTSLSLLTTLRALLVFRGSRMVGDSRSRLRSSRKLLERKKVR